MIWAKDGMEFECRDGTTDWNTVNAAVGEDEYGLASIDMLNKLVFDVGAHIGSIGIWCAVRGAYVICIEPIPENVEMIELNARRNGVQHLVGCGQAAAGAADSEIVIFYGYESNETERAHAYIGNDGEGAGNCKRAEVRGVSLTQMAEKWGYPDIVKLDCEGGEWHWFEDELINSVPLIVGEWHPTGGHTIADVVSALGHTHELSFTGPNAGPGGFTATRR
jgi:FkbM family methyltransferase